MPPTVKGGVSLTNAQISAIELFSGEDIDQDARRWFSRLEYSLGEEDEDEEKYRKRVVRLFDVKLHGEAARWADRTPEINEIIKADTILEADLEYLKTLFLGRYNSAEAPAAIGMKSASEDLADLKQGESETLESYFRRARRILVRICEDSKVGGANRVMTKSEEEWVMMTIRAFTRGMNDLSIGFQVEDKDPRSLEDAYMEAMKSMKAQKRMEERKALLESRGYVVPQYPFQGNVPFQGNASFPIISANAQRGYTSDPLPSRREAQPQRAPQTRPMSDSTVQRRALPPPQQSRFPAPMLPSGDARVIGPQGARAHPQAPPRATAAPSRGQFMVPTPVDPARSKNQYISGTAHYVPDSRNPLCVNCGEVGHISRNCTGRPLESWEREYLRSIVFPDTYQNSRSARLHRGGFELMAAEACEDDVNHYSMAGYDICEKDGEQGNDPQELSESMMSRFARLSVGGGAGFSRAANQEGKETEDRMNVDDTPGPSRPSGAGNRPIAPYKTVKIDDLLQGKRKERIESSSNGPSKKRVKEERKKGTKSKVRKRISDMDDEEKAEHERRKQQKKQLRMIRGMMGNERFDLQKALANTPCPISYLQYFQDSPAGRLEMSRINSITTNYAAAMFGDTLGEKHSRAAIQEADSESEDQGPRLGEGGAFMVTVTLSGGTKDQSTKEFISRRVCVDSGSDVDLITPSTARKINADMISMDLTPWGPLNIRTSSGSKMPLLAIARVKVTVHTVSNIIYVYVIPEEFEADTGYDLLLGIPWLFLVKGIINVAEGSIRIKDGMTGNYVTINAGKHKPHNFKVLFEEKGKSKEVADPTADEDTSGEVSTGYSTSDCESGEDSIKSSDATPHEASGRLNREATKFFVRNTVLEWGDQGDDGEINRSCRYVKAMDYLLMYGEDAPFSSIAQEIVRMGRVEVGDESDGPEGFFSGRNPVKLRYSRRGSIGEEGKGEVVEEDGKNEEEGEEQRGGEVVISNDRRAPQFPTERRPEIRKIDKDGCPRREELEEWALETGVNIGPLCPEYLRHNLLAGLWVYRDLNAKNLSDIIETDLIIHRINLVPGTVPYAVKGGKRLSRYHQEWLEKTILEGMASGMYERTPKGEPLSRWSAPPVIVCKDPEIEVPTDPRDYDRGPRLRLTFNYHRVYEDLPAIEHPLASLIHDILSYPGNVSLSKGDLKHGYWVVPTAIETRHILAFYIPGIGQLRPTRMPQGCRSSSSTMAELGAICFGAIPPPRAEPSIVGDTFGIFVDDMFYAERTSAESHLEFLFEKWFPRMAWGSLRMDFVKLHLFQDRLAGLGQTFHVGGTVSIFPERAQKILDWPTPSTKTEVRSFLGSVQICRRWIKNFSEIARPLTRLQGTTSWRWTEAEESSFIIIKNKCATTVAMHGIDWKLPVRCYFDASEFGGGFCLTQIQRLVEKPIIYDSLSFSPVQRKYGTYKRELLVIVHFANKYNHYFKGNHQATFFTDHQPLVSFINSDRHEGIYARWAIKLQELNFRFAYIEGCRNQTADGLSRTIFPGDDPTVSKEVANAVKSKDQRGEREWFWKDGKGGYEEMLREEVKRREKEAGMKKVEGAEEEKKKAVVFKMEGNKEKEPGEEGPTPGEQRARLSQLGKPRAQDAKGRKLQNVGNNESVKDFINYVIYKKDTIEEDSPVPQNRLREPPIPVLLPLDSNMSLTRSTNKEAWERVDEGNDDFVGIFARGVESEMSQVWGDEEWYGDVWRYLSNGELPEKSDALGRETLKKEAELFRIVRGNLYHFDRPRKRLIPCILERDVRKVLMEAHDKCGHYASSQCIMKLDLKAWWPNRNADVKTYVDGCISCAKYGPAVRSHALQPTLTFRPFDMIGIDFIGPLPTTTNGSRYILNVTDYFSRYVRTWACRSCTPEDVISRLQGYFEEFPIPICIYSDRGTHFYAKQVRNFCDRMEIMHIFSPSGSSKSTGMVERSNQEIEKALKRMCNDKLSAWDMFLSRATWAVNTRVIVALGYTPFELLFGIQPRLPFELSYPDEDLAALKASATSLIQKQIERNHPYDYSWEETLLGRNKELSTMRNDMLEKWKAKNASMKESYDKGLRGEGRFEIGDLVMLYDNTVGSKAKASQKLAVQWPGPYVITSLGGDHHTSYRLSHIHGTEIPGTHHGDHLKLYRPRTESHLKQPFDEEPIFGPRTIRRLRRKVMQKNHTFARTAILVGRNAHQTDTPPRTPTEREIEDGFDAISFINGKHISVEAIGGVTKEGLSLFRDFRDMTGCWD